MEQVVRIGHPGAVLEPEVDVLDLGRDEREVPRPLPDRDVVADEAPARSDAFDGVGNGLRDDSAQPPGGTPDAGRIALEEELGRDWVHFQMMSCASIACT